MDKARGKVKKDFGGYFLFPECLQYNNRWSWWEMFRRSLQSLFQELPQSWWEIFRRSSRSLFREPPQSPCPASSPPELTPAPPPSLPGQNIISLLLSISIQVEEKQGGWKFLQNLATFLYERELHIKQLLEQIYLDIAYLMICVWGKILNSGIVLDCHCQLI